MSSRENILDKVTNASISFTHRASDPVGFIIDESEDLLQEYIVRATENKVFVKISGNLLEDINEIITKEKVLHLIYPRNLALDVQAIEGVSRFPFDRAIEEFKERLFEFDLSIIHARKAVSSHGVFCITSSPEQPRLLSLTPKVCIVLLKKEDIVKSLSVAIDEIKREDGRFPTNILFICGPSRTSDIELVPVLGVHGSQIVYVLIH